MPAKSTTRAAPKRRTSTKAAPKRARTGHIRTPKKGQKTPAPARKAAARRAPTTPPITPDGPGWERAFITALANTGIVRAASQAAQVGRSTVYDRREASEAFAAAWDDALQEAADMMEAEALRRAVHGWQEPVYYKGKVVGHVLKHSDVLLIFILKAARPEKYRERYEHTGKDGGPIEFDARSVLAARLDAIATRGGPAPGPQKPQQQRG